MKVELNYRKVNVSPSNKFTHLVGGIVHVCEAFVQLGPEGAKRAIQFYLKSPKTGNNNAPNQTI